MAVHVYIKEEYTVKKQVIHTISYISLIAGALMLFWSFYPIISFELYSRIFIEQNIVSPIPMENYVSSLKVANTVLGSNSVYSNNLKDFVQANLWFPAMPQPTSMPSKIPVNNYLLSIPKLNIIDAKVKVGGDDLSKTLVHYLPTSLPGEKGNVAIFGHSTLPQLYNVKDYKTIFTYLPSLEKGDLIIVKMPDAQYEYQVFDMFVVDPDQISILDQKYDSSYLTVVTCVPPGTYWKRLVVRAKIKELSSPN
ncbi:MAG: sortase [Candidatus Roizmanbacteria bacterium]